MRCNSPGGCRPDKACPRPSCTDRSRASPRPGLPDVPRDRCLRKTARRPWAGRASRVQSSPAALRPNGDAPHFGVGLHPAVDGGDDPEARLGRCRRPNRRLWPTRKAILVFVSQHPLQFCAQGFPEIRGRAFIVAHPLELQAQRKRLQRICELGFEVVVFHHLGQHHIPSVAHQLRSAQGIVQRTVFQHAHQHGRLLHVEFRRRLVEVDVGGTFDAHRLVDEVVAVEVQCHNFLLGVVAFQAGRDDPLLGF